MNPELITLLVITGAIVLFVTEIVSIDIVALLIVLSLVLTGVISPQEGVAGFSNKATITVAFMFVLSAALLKTGALQVVAYRLAGLFRQDFRKGMLLMMLLIAAISAFVNNTPVVAVFIPVIIQIARASGHSPSKMLIPMSFASIFGGSCTLIGTSTNILVNGIAEKEGLAPIGVFDFSAMGLIFLAVGVGYMMFAGIKILPDISAGKDLAEKFEMNNYLSEIEILRGSEPVGKSIMSTALVKELGLDIIEVQRGGMRINMPSGDFVLAANDVLKVNCDISKIRELKDRAKVNVLGSMRIGGADANGSQSSLVELVIVTESAFAGQTLRSLDFRRRFRAIPLAIRHREEVLHNDLYQVELKAGDVILADVKNHFIEELRKMEAQRDTPFVLLSEDPMIDFNRNRFVLALGAIFTMVVLATAGVVDIMIGAIGASVVLVLAGSISMKEVYESINWKIVFLLAGALCLGTGMQNSGLDVHIASLMIDGLGGWGPVVVVSGLYLFTSLLTEIMSNNAAAALLAPIAIVVAEGMGLSPMPFLMAVMFAASASFMTPIGYHTNTMVFTAGQYRFMDFVKVGFPLNILFWILATVFIPLLFGF
jgi:di/tricarboxylate transporter